MTLNSANPQANAKFTGLDVLRGIAAISVVLFHMSDALKVPWLMPNGGLAVDLFFVMSGFVIAHAYDSRIPELRFSGFLRLRVIRFYPLYALGLSLGILRQFLLIAGGKHELSSVDITLSTLAALVFLPAPPSAISDSIAPLNGPAWSLIFEIWINAAYGLFFRFMTTPMLCLVVALAGASIVLVTIHGIGLGGPHWHDLPVGAARQYPARQARSCERSSDDVDDAPLAITRLAQLERRRQVNSRCVEELQARGQRNARQCLVCRRTSKMRLAPRPPAAPSPHRNRTRQDQKAK